MTPGGVKYNSYYQVIIKLENYSLFHLKMIIH